jgi:hypothetical protein
MQSQPSPSNRDARGGAVPVSEPYLERAGLDKPLRGERARYLAVVHVPLDRNGLGYSRQLLEDCHLQDVARVQDEVHPLEGSQDVVR